MHLEWYTSGPPIQHSCTLHLPTTTSTTSRCGTPDPHPSIMNSELYGCSPHFHHIIAAQYTPSSPPPPIQSCEAEREAKSSQSLEQLFGHLVVYGWRALPISNHNDAPSYHFIHHSLVALYRPHIPPTPVQSYTLSPHFHRTIALQYALLPSTIYSEL
ncbi:hypothetical protein T12_924 [Trichinella patagoniensis]|uniref:Uncharacterized protein n=1 Tax=Trichinella patagoniensis TaxID=990121 RepID=A0A0V0ZK41_9BILA|nr:hypothetical protein T12_924 [Trichinella patagoniensis]